LIHPDTTLRWISPEVGFGVFATKTIPKGTVTWVLDELDQVLSARHVEALGPAWAPVLQRYGYLDGQGNTVLSWDHARFVNHSCDSNTLSGGDDRYEIAVRDIAAGEQLTDDYTELNLLQERFACRCGSKRCRGVVESRTGTLPPERATLLAEALELGVLWAQPLAAWARHPLPLRVDGEPVA
jgi:hypothetical protein